MWSLHHNDGLVFVFSPSTTTFYVAMFSNTAPPQRKFIFYKLKAFSFRYRSPRLFFWPHSNQNQSVSPAGFRVLFVPGVCKGICFLDSSQVAIPFKALGAAHFCSCCCCSLLYICDIRLLLLLEYIIIICLKKCCLYVYIDFVFLKLIDNTLFKISDRRNLL
jgi:hypothetical protein